MRSPLSSPRSASWSAAVVVLTVLGGSAFAQPQRRVRFEYVRQEGASKCPELSAIQAGVAARLGYEPFDEAATELVRATIQTAGHGLEARIEMTDAKGGPMAQRRLVSRQRDCAELASSVELAVSIAIDPFRLATSFATSTPNQEVGAALPTKSQDQRPSEACQEPGNSDGAADGKAADSGSRPLSGFAVAGVVGGLGVAPSPSLGLVVGGGLRLGDWSLGLEGRADLPASKDLRVGEASTALLVASFLPCVHFGKVAACALASAGALHTAGHDLVESRQVTLPYVALGARLALHIPFSARWSLALRGEVTAPLVQAKVEVDNNVVWTAPILSAALGLGVAATFP